MTGLLYCVTLDYTCVANKVASKRIDTVQCNTKTELLKHKVCDSCEKHILEKWML